MKNLLTSAVLTVVAVPFLMAAPAAKKVQNSSATPAQTSSAKPRVHRKHSRKAQKSQAVVPSAAAPATAPAK